ncbi:insulinase family protein [Algoriphagus sp.]|uniref:insulinase family protein n=1 Tax=Algoriphagus sp. TaxID=1872435 RepID=UPI00261D5221|nr:insulinase family protein [Algoriphagus sp.]
MKNILSTFIIGLLSVSLAYSQVDRSQLPASGPAPEIKIGDAETFTLDNGLKVFVVNNDKLPRVSFSLVLDRDPLFEGDKAGLTGFVGQMLTAGTANRTKDQLDEEIDFIGASLSASSTSVFASSLKKHQDKILELMADVLYNPTFPEEELEKIRKQTLTGLAQSKDNPDAIASRLAAAMVYGKDHPYGEVSTEETINNISIEDVKEYYQTYFKPNIAYLVIVGDMTKDEAEQVVGTYFSQWEKGEVPSFDYPTPTRTNATKVGLVDRSSSVQTVINVSQPVSLKLGDEDYIPSRLLNQILGGGSSSRLFVNLREDKGYTYGAYSSIGSDRLIARFSANASVRTEVTDSAMVEMLYEIKKIVEEGVTEEELEKAKANLSGSFGRSLESPSTIANFALNIERYDLPKDYYANYLKNLNSLTVEDINATAKRLIDPDKLYVMAVGNGDAIKDKLAQFGPITMYDNLGFEAKELTADADMTAEKVIDKYLEAIGGAESIRNVKTAKLSMDADAMGTQVSMVFSYDANGRYSQKTLVGGNVVQKTTVLESGGTISAQGQSMEIPADQLESAKINSYLFPEALYEDLGYAIRLEGLKDVEGTPAYKVVLVSESGAELINYYDQQTGLKIKNENPSLGDTFYSDYQSKAGVLIPMAWTIKSPMIPVPLEGRITNVEINPTLSEDDFN